MGKLWSEMDQESLDKKDWRVTTTWNNLCGPALNAVDFFWITLCPPLCIY